MAPAGLARDPTTVLALLVGGAFERLIRFLTSGPTAVYAAGLSALCPMRRRLPHAARSFRDPGHPLLRVLAVAAYALIVAMVAPRSRSWRRVARPGAWRWLPARVRPGAEPWSLSFGILGRCGRAPCSRRGSAPRPRAASLVCSGA